MKLNSDGIHSTVELNQRWNSIQDGIESNMELKPGWNSIHSKIESVVNGLIHSNREVGFSLKFIPR